MTRAPLSQLDDWQLENSDQDLRGRMVMSEDGRKLGTIREMIVNTDTEYVEALVLDDGTEIFMSDIRIADDAVYYRDPMEIPNAAAITTADTRTRDDNEIAIPIIAEEIRVGKRYVEGGGVQVSTKVETVPVEKQVTLRDEVVEVERRAANRPVEDEYLAFQEGTFEIHEHDEEAIVDKHARGGRSGDPQGRRGTHGNDSGHRAAHGCRCGTGAPP